jgi:hypothetical protein
LLPQSKDFQAIIRQTLMMENLSTTTNLHWLACAGVEHQYAKALIALENGVHHYPITKLKNMKR